MKEFRVYYLKIDMGATRVRAKNKREAKKKLKDRLERIRFTGIKEITNDK